MNWIHLALRSDPVARSLKVAGIIGTLLVVINNGDFLLAGDFDSIHWIKVFFTCCVPYGVSAYASVAALMDSEKRP